MRFSPIVIFHIFFGSLGLLSGTAAMIFRKGYRWHRAAGNVFVVSMLCLAASGSYLGFAKHQTLNGMMGVLTFYLVGTAWWTARRRDGQTGSFDWVALIVPLVVAAVLFTNGFDAANSSPESKGGFPAPAYFIFGSMALLFAAGDIRMLARGGVSGKQRIARHLSRMCVGLFISTGSLFLGQQQVFPEALRKSGLLFIPALLPLALFIFWLLRIRFTNAYNKMLGPTRSATDSIQA